MLCNPLGYVHCALAQVQNCIPDAWFFMLLDLPYNPEKLSLETVQGGLFLKSAQLYIAGRNSLLLNSLLTQVLKGRFLILLFSNRKMGLTHKKQT